MSNSSVPRLKDVAKAANVSLAAASRILRGDRERFGDETCRRVLEASRQLGWRRNLLVNGMQTGRTQTIGVMIPPFDSFWVSVLSGILAGPTCARTLAEHGAEVLRIGTDLLPNNETQIIETGHGKRSTVLDLTSASGVDQLRTLAKTADVFSQGYRPGALAAKGFGVEDLTALRPGIVYLSLNAFSHVGPWSQRRGFDTLVQSVSGICDDYAAEGRPRLLPVSALDYITGYLAAFGVMAALGRRARVGGSYHVRISLAQAGWWLTHLQRMDPKQVARAPRDLTPERIAALSIDSQTPFGRLTHLGPIAHLSETPGRYELPTVPLDHDPPEWLTSRPDAARSG